jgi:hypothetical protein
MAVAMLCSNGHPPGLSGLLAVTLESIVATYSALSQFPAKHQSLIKASNHWLKAVSYLLLLIT